MKFLKIDFVIGSLNAGGAERVVVNLANYFATKGHCVRIITFNPGGNYLLNKSVEIIKLDKKGLIKPTIIRATFNLLKFYKNKRNRPDIINSHINLMGYAVIPCKFFYKIPIISSEHSNHLNIENRFLNKMLWDWFYRFFDAITLLTSFDEEFFGKRNKKVIVMGNPCSFKPYTSNNIKRKKIILAVGSMKRFKDKGFDVLLHVSSKVLQKHQEWELHFVGGGNHGIGELEALSKKLEIEKQVQFLGYRDDVAEIMRESEIFVLSSKYEGLPMALLEAMSQGMACIAYDCISGPSDIINDGVNGLLIENQNETKLGEGISLLIENEELRKKLRANSPKSATKFSIEEVGDKWLDLINDLVHN